MNTHFQKHPKSLCTYSEVSNTTGGPPWDATRYAQIDYSLAPSRWKNSVQNVEAFPDAQTDSDHFLVVTSLLVKLKANKKLPGNTRFKFKNPSPEQILHFNSAISRDCRSLSDSGEDPSVWLREFNSNILTSARESFSHLPRQQRKSYLSDETWRLIELKRQYRIIGDKQAEIETRKLVRRSARKDKVTHLVNSFENAQHVEDRWKSIRSARKKFVPRFVRFKNRHGEYIDFSEKASATADYLANVQWSRPEPCPSKINPRPIIFDDLNLDDSDFSLGELKSVLAKSKQNKAPGPDDITADMLKLFNDENLQFVLDIVNHCWNTSVLPSDLELASVTSIFKKGNPALLHNYRPISLLSIFYKLFAALVLHRLRPKIDPYVWKTQFGFRRAHSTQQAVFLARRAQDQAEMSGTNLIFTLLDFEKAFDRVDQPKLLEALRRLNISGKTLGAIQAMYRNPRFFVKDMQGKSVVHTQGSGIRQGCPLSPFLFILLMTVLFHDVYDVIGVELLNNRLPHIRYSDILYADDTLLITTGSHLTHRFLSLIEKESAYYNLKFNHSKCQVLCMNGNKQISFQNGERLENVNHAKYLGCLLSKDACVSTEISGRIASAMDAVTSFKKFWTCNCPIAWKLAVYESIVDSRLTYGLETLQLNANHLKRLDAFQQKGLRRILKIPPTFVNRTWTNARVLEAASSHRPQRTVSAVLEARKLKLIGHLLRSHGNDVMRCSVISSNYCLATPPHRRQGRPRHNWSYIALKAAWASFGNPAVFKADLDQINFLHTQAVLRHGVFG